MSTPAGAVLLGYGGWEHSKIALAWADDLAVQLSRPLHVLVSALHVADVPGVPKEHLAGHVTAELEQLLATVQAPEKSMATVRICSSTFTRSTRSDRMGCASAPVRAAVRSAANRR